MPEKVLKSPDLGFLEKRGDPEVVFLVITTYGIAGGLHSVVMMVRTF